MTVRDSMSRKPAVHACYEGPFKGPFFLSPIETSVKVVFYDERPGSR